MESNIKIPGWANRLMNIAAWLVIILPPLVYFLFVHKYALNKPRQDDYDAILSFVIDFRKGGASEKFALLFSQHNEHRIFFSRLLYVVYYKLTGVINFRSIIFINYAILTGIYLLVVAFSRKMLPGMWKLAAAITSICLYSTSGYENGDFAMAGTQNFGVILLFIGSMYAYGRKDMKWLPVAMLLQGICVFTSGNGNVAAFFLVAYTALNRFRPAMMGAIATFLLVSPFYYYHYTQPGSGFFSTEITRIVPYFLRVVGSHFGRDLSILSGVVLLSGLLVVFPKQSKWKFGEGTLPFVCILGFAFSSAAVLSVFRAGLPLDTAYSSRYFIYSNLIVLILSLWLVLKVTGTKMQVPAITFLLLCISFIYIRNIREGQEGFAAFHNELLENDYHYPDKVRAKMLTDESCRLGIYCMQASDK